jgi:hypothetical protein
MNTDGEAEMRPSIGRDRAPLAFAEPIHSKFTCAKLIRAPVSMEPARWARPRLGSQVSAPAAVSRLFISEP